MKKCMSFILAMLLGVSLFGCTSSGEQTPTPTATNPTTSAPEATDDAAVTNVKIATIPNIEPRVQICKEILAEIGVDVEVVVFDGNSMPATALKDGDVDALLVNHLKWINTFNEANNCNLVMLQPYYYYSPIRLYSLKWKTADEFPQNATVVVSNDPSNFEIALLMLEDFGLIELSDEKTGDFYTDVDIVSNPKNIQLIQAETINVARSINDADAVVSFAYYVYQAGADQNDYLAENPTDKEECPVGIVVQPEDEDAEWANYLAQHLLDDKWTDAADEFYPEGCYPYYK